MAELLIRVVDKIGDDVYLDSKCLKRGDVVVAREDGWQWSDEERSAPFWRIVVIKGMSLTEAEVFTSPELPDDPLVVSKTLRKRAFKFNLDHPDLPKEFKDVVDDHERKDAALVIELAALEAAVPFASLKEARPKIEDPAVLGDNPKVIG